MGNWLPEHGGNGLYDMSFIKRDLFVWYNIVFQNTKELVMTATVRLDDNLTQKLDMLSRMLHKKKSDVMRDALAYYARDVEAEKKSKIRAAVAKVHGADKAVYDAFEGAFDDGIER